MNNYCLYYNQNKTYVSAGSFDMVYLGNKCWYMPGTVLFVENVRTKEIRKYVVN